jgi:drug/metabolite transporter (DMT)-like permease
MPLLERVRPRLSSAVAAVFAVAGLYLITQPDLQGLNLGDLLTIGCSFAFAFHIIVVDLASTRYDPITLTFWQVALAGAISLVALGGAEHPYLRLTPWTITAIIVTGVFATALAFGVQVWGQRETPATHAAIIFSAEPMFATLFAYVIQGEQFTPTAWLGALLILAGMLVTQVRPRRTAAQPL